MDQKRLNRRDFLRLSALTAAGAALAGCGPAPTPQVIKETVEVPVEKTVVVRFMAPSAGDFRCRVTLTSSDPRGGDGLSVSVVLGDATLASGLFPNGGEVTLEAPFREVFYDPQSLEIRVGSRESAACDSAFVRVDVSPK